MGKTTGRVSPTAASVWSEQIPLNGLWAHCDNDWQSLHNGDLIVWHVLCRWHSSQRVPYAALIPVSQVRPRGIEWLAHCHTDGEESGQVLNQAVCWKPLGSPVPYCVIGQGWNNGAELTRDRTLTVTQRIVTVSLPLPSQPSTEKQ